MSHAARRSRLGRATAVLVALTALGGCSAPTTALPSPTAPSGTSPVLSGASASAAPAKSKPPFTPAPTPSIANPDATKRPSRGGVTFYPTDSGDLTGKIIVVDPGHNGMYAPWIHNDREQTAIGNRKCMEAGTVSVDKVEEHTFNWDLSLKVRDLMLSQGATVIMTRPTDWGAGPCNNERAEIANRAKADFFLSVHGDGDLRKGDPRGFHVQVETKMAGGQALASKSLAAAENVVREMGVHTSQPVTNYIVREPAGIWQREGELAVLAGLKTTPGILFEAGNMRNASEWAQIKDPAVQQKIAEALTDAVIDTLTKPEFMTPAPTASATPSVALSPTPSGPLTPNPSAAATPTVSVAPTMPTPPHTPAATP